MTEQLQEKIHEAEEVLKLAAEMSRTYYGKPLILCYSGGKDSDVMLDIAKKCLKSNEFEVLNSHTTVDAPETVYHIREVFKRCESEGIHTEIRMPRYKGKPTSMWKLIEDKGIPPTRVLRYCCSILKEASTPNRLVAVGVREDESAKRQNRGSFAFLDKRVDEREWRSLQHTYAMFKLDQYGDKGAYECKFIQSCKANKDTICNPIYYFKEVHIWEYIQKFNVFINPLYSKGWKRVGCIGCPLAGPKCQNQEFLQYPIYKKNYIKAFERMLKRRKADGKPYYKHPFSNGEEVFRWWLGEDPKQVRIEDLLKDEKEQDNGRNKENSHA